MQKPRHAYVSAGGEVSSTRLLILVCGYGQLSTMLLEDQRAPGAVLSSV